MLVVRSSPLTNMIIYLRSPTRSVPLQLPNAAEWTAGEKERNRPASLTYSVTWHELVP